MTDTGNIYGAIDAAYHAGVKAGFQMYRNMVKAKKEQDEALDLLRVLKTYRRSVKKEQLPEYADRLVNFEKYLADRNKKTT